MAKTKKKLTKEEKLAKDRLRKKMKFAELKSDPERYRIHQEKEKKRYLEKKEKKKVVSIEEMSQRAKREQRRRWRKNSLNYLKKKKEQKKVQQILLENSPPESENEEFVVEKHPDIVVAPEADPLASESPLSCPCKKVIRKLRYSNLKMKEELIRLKKRNIILRRNESQKETKDIEDTLEKKVNNIINDIKDDKIKQVKRKLLFTESVTKGFLEKYKQSNKKEKKTLTGDILKNREKMKKYRVLSKLPFSVRKKNAESNQGKKIARSKLQVLNFFEEDVNSQVAAGKNEYIKRGGVKKQKRYLTDNLKNLHNKFCKQWGYISYSLFCKYRPFWINYPNNRRDTCQCKLHANVELLIKSLKQNKIINEGSATEVITSLCCDIYNQICLERSCIICKKRHLHYKEFDNSKNIIYYEWILEKQKYTAKNGKEMFKNATTKKKREDRPRNVVKKLEMLLNAFFKHHRNIIIQYVAIKELKQNLAINEVLCHVDFSENFCLKHHEEIQSFHFGGSRGQVSLHTGVLYFLDEHKHRTTKSFCTMSQCLNHDASAIWAHITPILELGQRLVPTLTAIHFVSDSPSSQYRNRYIFHMLTKLKDQISTLQEVTWSYLESGHGKGAPDGVGAVVKRTADNYVKYGGDIGSFQEFVEVVQQNVQNVELILIPEEEVTKKRFPRNVPAFKGTTKVHQVVWSSELPYNVAFRTLSCFACRDSYVPCEHNKHLGVLSGFDEMATVTSGIGEIAAVTTRSKRPHVNDPEASNIEMFIHSPGCGNSAQDFNCAILSNDIIQTQNTIKAPNGCDYNNMGSPLLIDSPTIFNNVGHLISMTDDCDGNGDVNALEEDNMFTPPIQDSNKKVKSSVNILSNVPYNYQRFSFRNESAGFNSVDQSEFQKFLKSSSNDTEPDFDKGISYSMHCDYDLKYDVDMWVAVEYKNKNSSQFFIGKIIDKCVSTKEYTIIFVRKARGGLFGWPTVSDEDSVPESYIIKRLEDPQESRRGQYSFKNLPEFNFK